MKHQLKSSIWFSIHFAWFSPLKSSKKDLENFRLKIRSFLVANWLRALAPRFWPDFPQLACSPKMRPDLCHHITDLLPHYDRLPNCHVHSERDSTFSRFTVLAQFSQLQCSLRKVFQPLPQFSLWSRLFHRESKHHVHSIVIRRFHDWRQRALFSVNWFHSSKGSPARQHFRRSKLKARNLAKFRVLQNAYLSVRILNVEISFLGHDGHLLRFCLARIGLHLCKVRLEIALWINKRSCSLIQIECDEHIPIDYQQKNLEKFSLKIAHSLCCKSHRPPAKWKSWD